MTVLTIETSNLKLERKTRNTSQNVAFLQKLSGHKIQKKIKPPYEKQP